ncbi:hypothetical protein JCM10908_003463 [Rhodotorula pacifica]|uniref:uncharacterized protein n=1 Tax=Rhodotorula pacifica TaxID=1495444 RepID=UPI00317F6FAA
MSATPTAAPQPSTNAADLDVERDTRPDGSQERKSNPGEKAIERLASSNRTSETGDTPDQDDTTEDEEAAAEELLDEEEAEDEEAAEEPKGVTGLLSSVLRWRQHHQAPAKDAETAEHGPLDPLATPDTRLLPILSGLACPFSVLLEIPGLTESWYVKTYGYTIIDTRPNPVLLDVGLAISLALGIAANVFLVARFLEFRPKRFTIAAIVALTLHDAINIAAVSWFGISKRHADGFNYNDTFWMTVASTVASTICNVTLVLDLVHTRDFVRKGSGLTERQRALMVTVMFLFLYLGLGALCYFYLIPDLRFVDALFFVEVTVFTVGFGDPVPVTPGAKTFTGIYASIGIVAFALTVAVARETIIETFEVTYRARRARLAQKARERKEHHLRRLRKELELKQAQAQAQAQAQTSSFDANGARTRPDTDDNAAASRFRAHVLSHQSTVLEQQVTKMRGWKRWLVSFFSGRRKAESFSTAPLDQTTQSETDGGAAFERRVSTLSLTSTNTLEVSFRSLKQELAKEEQQEFRTKLGISLFFFFIFWLGGAGVFVACEKWTYGNAVWFAFETFSTIGYGDFIPYTAAGRAFFIPWSIVGIGNMTLLFSVLSEAWSSRYKSKLQAGRVRRLVRRRMMPGSQAPKKVNGGNGAGEEKKRKVDTLGQLLDMDGYKSVADQPVPPEDLPGKIVETIRSFHAHARYFMLGRTGDPPPQLQVLLDAADDVDTQLETLLVAKTSALAESAASRDTKHYLFLLSYEREFDRVVESANQLATAIDKAGKELVALNIENDRLQAELRQLRLETGSIDPNSSSVDIAGADSAEAPSLPRTPTLSFTTPSPVVGGSNRKHRSASMKRTNTFPRTNTTESSSSTSNPAPSSLGVRGGAALRHKHLF